MSLQAKLDAFKADFEAGEPPYNMTRAGIETMHRATQELIASGLAQRALKAGDVAPSFTLSDPEGAQVSSADLLAKGPLVVSFYRGIWCPYCNMELQALQAALSEFRKAGASLVAISPQTPVNSRKSVRTNALDFPILSDPHNELATALRPVLADWTLPPLDLWALYPTGRMPSAKARAFAAFVEAELKAARPPAD